MLGLLQMVIYNVPSETIKKGHKCCTEWALKDWVVNIDKGDGLRGMGGDVMSKHGAKLSLNEGSKVYSDVLWQMLGGKCSGAGEQVPRGW